MAGKNRKPWLVWVFTPVGAKPEPAELPNRQTEKPLPPPYHGDSGDEDDASVRSAFRRPEQIPEQKHPETQPVSDQNAFVMDGQLPPIPDNPNSHTPKTADDFDQSRPVESKCGDHSTPASIPSSSIPYREFVMNSLKVNFGVAVLPRGLLLLFTFGSDNPRAIAVIFIPNEDISPIANPGPLTTSRPTVHVRNIARRFIADELTKDEFVTLATALELEDRDDLVTLIRNRIAETGITLTRFQKAALAELDDYDEIDREFYTDTQGGE